MKKSNAIIALCITLNNFIYAESENIKPSNRQVVSEILEDNSHELKSISFERLLFSVEVNLYVYEAYMKLELDKIELGEAFALFASALKRIDQKHYPSEYVDCIPYLIKSYELASKVEALDYRSPEYTVANNEAKRSISILDSKYSDLVQQIYADLGLVRKIVFENYSDFPSEIKKANDIMILSNLKTCYQILLLTKSKSGKNRSE